MKRQGGARCLGGGEGLWGRGCQLRRGQQIGPPGKQQLMHPRGRGGVSAGRMGQGGHLPGRPQGIWPVSSWDVTTTWLGSGLRCPLVALRGARPEPVQVSTSPRLRAPPAPPPSHLFLLPFRARLGALPVLSGFSPCTLPLGARAHPGPALTGGSGKPFRVLPGVHPKGRESPSSYSAGSQRASALLAAPRAGFLLKPSKTRPQPRPALRAPLLQSPGGPVGKGRDSARGKGGAGEAPLRRGAGSLNCVRSEGAGLWRPLWKTGKLGKVPI